MTTFISPAAPPAATPALQRLALIGGIAVVSAWGANFAVQKALFAVMPPGAFLLGRYVMVALCSAGLLLYTSGWRWPRLPRADLRQLALLGVLGHTMHVSLVTFGIHWSTAFSSALIMACGPVFTLLILHWSGVERLSRAQVGGVALACAGVLVFLSDKLLGRQWAATGGDLVMLFSASLFSYYTVMTKPLIQRHGGVVVTAYATLAGTPLLLLMGLPSSLTLDWSHLGALHWSLLVWAALVPAFIGWLVWGWVNERRGVARTAPLMYLMPLVAGVGAWWATGEHFSWAKIGGAAVALAGVALAQFAGAAPSAVAREQVPQID